MTEKKLLSMIECSKQFQGILSVYEVEIISHHKNLVYEATMSASQRVMRWRLIFKGFGPNIQYISEIYNIVVYTLSHLPLENTDREKPSIISDLHQSNELFAFNND